MGDWLSEPGTGHHLLGGEVDRGSQLLSDSSTDSDLVRFTVLGGVGVDTELGVGAGEEHGVARKAVLRPPSLSVCLGKVRAVVVSVLSIYSFLISGRVMMSLLSRASMIPSIRSRGLGCT